MVMTATAFQHDFDAELPSSANEDINLTENGKTIAKLSKPNVSAVDALSGLLAGTPLEEFDSNQLREARLRKYVSHA